MLYVTSLRIYIAEHEAQPKFRSFFDALWFAVETLSTVGYGDLVPITPMGRIFTGVIMFIAVSIIAISTGLITSAFSRVWQCRRSFCALRKRPADKVAAEAGGRRRRPNSPAGLFEGCSTPVHGFLKQALGGTHALSDGKGGHCVKAEKSFP